MVPAPSTVASGSIERDKRAWVSRRNPGSPASLPDPIFWPAARANCVVNEKFILLCSAPQHFAALGSVAEIYFALDRPDQNFVGDFQQCTENRRIRQSTGTQHQPVSLECES